MRKRPIDVELPAPVIGAFDEEQLRFAREAWPMRAAQELRSALVFRALARAARMAQFPEPWPSRFDSAVRDELRHTRLCATIGARLGASPPAYDAAPVRERLAALPDARLRAISLLLVEVAIGETISMYLFRAGRRAAIEPLTRAALGAIAVDEVRHQRLGWSSLGAIWPSLDESLRDWMQAEAARGLAGCEQSTAAPAMLWLKEGRRFDPAYGALGVLDPEVRVETFYAAVERLVVPRLTRLGLDGARAWSDRYRASGSHTPRRVSS
jgi:hypothetical protein